jgi:hypothetical protein
MDSRAALDVSIIEQRPKSASRDKRAVLNSWFGDGIVSGLGGVDVAPCACRISAARL